MTNAQICLNAFARCLGSVWISSTRRFMHNGYGLRFNRIIRHGQTQGEIRHFVDP